MLHCGLANVRGNYLRVATKKHCLTVLRTGTSEKHRKALGMIHRVIETASGGMEMPCVPRGRSIASGGSTSIICSDLRRLSSPTRPHKGL